MQVRTIKNNALSSNVELKELYVAMEEGTENG